MKAWLLFMAGLVLLSLGSWWSRTPVWQDGNYRAYDTDAGLNLGFYHHPGTVVIVQEEVVALGSDAQWIVAEQRWKGQRLFYIIRKDAVTHDNGIDYYVGKPEGPLTPEDYAQEAMKRGLPPFSWHEPSPAS